MKRQIILILVLVLSGTLSAQDTIFMQNGEVIKSKVLEVSSESIKYKEFDFQDGPLRIIRVKDVNMIVYQNGKKEIISGEKKQLNLPFIKTKSSSNKTANEQQKEPPVQNNLTKPETQKEVTPPTAAKNAEPQKNTTPQNKTGTSPTQKENSPSNSTPKTSVQVDTKTNQPTSSAQKLTAQQDKTRNTSVQNESPASVEPAKTLTQNQLAPGTENDLSEFVGTWKSDNYGKIHLVLAEEGFKFQYLSYPGAWMYYKPTGNLEYTCTKVEGNNQYKSYVGSKMTLKNSDKIELLFGGVTMSFIRFERAIPIKSQDDISLLNGFWKISSDRIFGTASVYELSLVNSEIRIVDNADNSQTASFRLTVFPEFECYQATGKRMAQFQQSKINILDHNSITITNSRETLRFFRTRLYIINDKGEVYSNKKKIATIKKLTSGSLMNVEMPTWTIYDVNNTPCFRYDGKYIFLDDNKSFIPSQNDPRLEAIGAFLAGEDILTPEGFNKGYRAEFIRKYRGFDNTPGIKENIRDKTASVQVDGTIIRQGTTIIGHLEYIKTSNDGTSETIVKILSIDEKLVARIIISPKNSYSQVKIQIFLGNNSTAEWTINSAFFQPYSNTNRDDAIKWLVEHNHL